MSEKQYWTTLEQKDGTEDYLKYRDDEFRHKPAEDMEEGGGLNLDRRNFMKASGAAAVFAAASGCSPEKKLIPYHTQPEELIPGNPVYYASIDADGEIGLLVKTTEGRPIRLDGNPEHPVNKGKLDSKGNAAIIDLYDPDRLRSPIENIAGQAKEIEDIKNDPNFCEKLIAEKLKSAGNKAVIVTKPIHGVAQKALIKKLKAKYPGLKHIEISTKAGIDQEIAAQKASFGTAVLPTYRYDKAKLVVSLGYDLLSESANSIETSRYFADCRRYNEDKETMGRVISFEPNLSMTGGSGDERFRVHPTELPEIALMILDELKKKGASVPANIKTLSVSSFENRKKENKNRSIAKGKITSIANELWKNKGKSLVVGGGTGAQNKNGLELLNLINLINVLLENDGKTINYGDGALHSHMGTENGLATLIKEAKAGNIKALIINDLNLAYTTPASYGLEEALAQIPFITGLLSHNHETGLLCNIVLPINHFLESWNDAEPRKGLYSLGQPTISPLWSTKSAQAYLLNIANEGEGKIEWQDFIKNTWKSEVYNSNVFAGNFESFWTSALRKGVVDLGTSKRDTKLKPRKFNAAAIKNTTTSATPSEDVLVLITTDQHGDGHSMNNPWLLEAPDAISKICWDNYASFSVKRAKKEGIKEGDHVKLKTDAGEITIPAHIQPGTHDHVIEVQLGWGRTAVAGQVAAGQTGNGNGVNASPLIAADGILNGISVSFNKVGGHTELACMQGHQYLENPLIRASGEGSRKIVQDTTFKEFKEDPEGKNWKIKYHAPTDVTLWRQKFESQTHKWAMAIDTNTCTGCNACTISCQAENNISVVGKDEVLLNREMHWIRIDRYYTALDPNQYAENADEVDVIQQPMLCQHCDNAPCETVCPVVATSHNEEGINIQTYNRCVGTRYCSNNCPYKVRHYNWYDYSDYRAGLHDSGKPLKRFLRQLGISGKALKDKTEYPLMMQFNPDVTVRSRGVMEKCSFCVHKIQRWKTEEEQLGRSLPETAKQAACQQACPTNAITFGDILDENSDISKKLNHKGSYKVLKELNTEANVTYLTRLRNREPGADAYGHDSHGGHGDSHASHKSNDSKPQKA